MSKQATEHPNKSGRHSLSDVDRLRARIWYCAVKRCGDWSDYKLDMQFGQEDGPMTEGGAGRTRVFGVIKSKGTIPSCGDHPRRTFDLVRRVDDHPQFTGTKEVIYSPFWDLLELPPHDLEKTSSFVIDCMKLLNLTRLTGKDSFEWMMHNHHRLFQQGQQGLKSTGVSPYEASLNDATNRLPCDLNQLALLGGLYREACLSFNPMIAEITGIYFRLTLERYCEGTWLGVHGHYLQDVAINRILYGKSDYIPQETCVNKEEDIFDTPELQSQGFVVSRNDPFIQDFFRSRGSRQLYEKD